MSLAEIRKIEVYTDGQYKVEIELTDEGMKEIARQIEANQTVPLSSGEASKSIRKLGIAKLIFPNNAPASQWRIVK